MFLNYIDDNIGVMHHLRKTAGRWTLQGEPARRGLPTPGAPWFL